MNGKILVIEDEESIREYMCYLLTNNGFSVVEAENGEDGLDLFSKQPFDLVVTDMTLPLKNGSEIMNAIRKINKKIAIVAVSGTMSAKALLKDAGEGGADAIIQKPFTEKEFLTTIEHCFEKSHR
jgi:DNA-binding response OmpR family regulator